jgi:hypothetical protein
MTTPMRDLRLPTSFNWATQSKIGAIQSRTRRDGPARGLNWPVARAVRRCARV